MRVLFSLLACLAILVACMPGNPSKPTAPVGTIEYLEQQREICEARGGRFGGAPGNATKVCYIEPKDANQACSRASDCEGHCLARSRTCAPIIPLFGCNEVLMEGGRPATVCLD